MLTLPQLASTEYVFNTREELSKLAEDIPHGDTCQSWIRTCKERQIYVCGGLAQRDGDKFFDIAVLIGPDGFIGKYRKVHLWDEEKLFFEPEDLGFPIFYFPFGRVGMIVCYDGWYPEVSRILALNNPKGRVTRACPWVSTLKPDDFTRFRYIVEKAAPGGGYIISSSNSIYPERKPENYIAMVHAAREYGV